MACKNDVALSEVQLIVCSSYRGVTICFCCNHRCLSKGWCVIGSLVELFHSVSKKIILVLRVSTICGMMAMF